MVARIGWCIALVLVLQTGSRGQDFSNRGKDFWLCFPSHVPNERDGNTYYAKMSVFITADKNSSGTVSIPGVFNAPFNVTAGQVAEIDVPYNLAHITSTEAGTIVRKGIHVQTAPGRPAVVVYAHIYAGFRSAASLILPVPVLGKKYYSMNARQLSITGSKSQFVVMAVDTGTTVLITPSRNGIKGTPFTINLPLPGDCYEVQDNFDLTGSSIESISSGTEGCKKIAVFAGSSGIHITGGACLPADSYDPLYQQLYPVQAWGKQYGFIPFRNYTNGNPYRILAMENNTQVYMDGIPVATLDEGEYYPDNISVGMVETRAVMISADKPVSVAHYAQSSACSGANPPAGTGYGDPDMVLLNPVEQQADNITVFSSQKENIYADSKFINVLIKTAATASFTINGAAPGVTWQPLSPAGSGFSWASIQLSGNTNAFTLAADSTFNAIAYGFGDFESYAYSAGTHVKDLYRTLTVENEFGNATEPVGCSNNSFGISVTIPYQPQSLSFRFYGLFPDEQIMNPVPAETFVQNGKIVYRYRLTNRFKIAQAGNYPVTVVAESNIGSGCDNGKDEMDYEIRIVERPKAEFDFTHNGCITDAIRFSDTSDAKGSVFKNYYWNFGDNNNSTQRSPIHNYAAANTYEAAHWAITEIGCDTDTVKKTIRVTNIPVAAFTAGASVCKDAELLFTDQSTITGPGTIDSLIWNFGDQTLLRVRRGERVAHHYTAQGLYTISLQVKTSSGCQGVVANQLLNVHPVPMASFTVPVFCLPAGTGQFLNTSTISTGNLTAAWDFGDGNNSVVESPVHRYNSVGPFSVKLTVSSVYNCVDDTVINVTSIIPQEKIQSSINAEVCLGDISHIRVNPNALLNTLYWSSDNSGIYADTTINKNLAEIFLPLNFARSGPHTVQVFGISATGCNTDTAAHLVYINSVPVPDFRIQSPFCENRVVQFTDRSITSDGAINKWHWDFGNGKRSSTSSPQQIFASGDYSVALSVETDKGCRSSNIIYPLVISPVPVPDFTSPGSCVADPFVPFTDRSTIADGSEDRFVYKWYFGTDSSILKNPQHSYALAGEYPVRLRITSKDGCDADTIKNIVVNGARVNARFIMNAGLAICNDKPVILQDNSSVDAGSLIRTEIYWNYGRDPLQNTIDDSPAKGASYNFKYPITAGDETYRLRYIVYSGISCLYTLDTIITVKKSPVVQFNTMQDVCENLSPFMINAASDISGLAGTGSYSGTGISPAGQFNPGAAKAGAHNLMYTYTAQNGCVATARQTLRVLASPVVNAGPDKTLREGASVSLEGSATGTSLQFRWTPETHMDNPSAPAPRVTPSTDITYKLTVRNADGCTAEDETNVKVISKINIPNAFTPNFDGRHDVWNIPNLELFENCSVQVFSRWGEKVYQSKGYTHPWDGNVRGRQLPAGTYTYIIDLKNGQPPLKGFVLLIR